MRISECYVCDLMSSYLVELVNACSLRVSLLLSVEVHEEVEVLITRVCIPYWENQSKCRTCMAVGKSDGESPSTGQFTEKVPIPPAKGLGSVKKNLPHILGGLTA